MKSIAEVRDDLMRFVSADLVGPAHGTEEAIEDLPRIRYAAGVLFPQDSVRNESDAVSGVEGDAEAERGEEMPPIDPETSQVVGQDSLSKTEREPESEYDDTVTLANSYRPSAIGLSFCIQSSAEGLVVAVQAATYNSERHVSDDGHTRTKWKRQPLKLEPVSLKVGQVFEIGEIQLAEGLVLHSVKRPRDDQTVLITLSLYNSTLQYERKSKTFFQTAFEVRSEDGGGVFHRVSIVGCSRFRR